jgi:two-component system sensor histidine kinase TctE
MMPPSLSLRTRLLVFTLIPLTLASLGAGYWRISSASQTTQQIFDRTLIALTLAISRDITLSGGDTLSDATHSMLRDNFAGRIFYHVYGPDGFFITGYATPPLTPSTVEMKENTPVLFESRYRGEQVRVARLREFTDFETTRGYSSITVWQTMSGRKEFIHKQAMHAIIVIGSLFLTVAAVAWFGIKLGLKPLADLQNAVARRSSDDLSEIRRPVPPEVTGLVATLNNLFGQVGKAIASRDRFISDAAHQLRNPIAGLLSLAQAARKAKTREDMHERVLELVEAARHASRLTTQLLSLERAKGQSDRSRFAKADLNRIAREVCEQNAGHILERNIDFEFRAFEQPVPILADRLLVKEAVQNLIDNAIKHAGSNNSQISVHVTMSKARAMLYVVDKGIGLKQEDSELAFSRFSQITPGEGSGLGLAIIDEIARLHNGKATIEPSETGAIISISFPVAKILTTKRPGP